MCQSADVHRASLNWLRRAQTFPRRHGHPRQGPRSPRKCREAKCTTLWPQPCGILGGRRHCFTFVDFGQGSCGQRWARCTECHQPGRYRMPWHSESRPVDRDRIPVSTRVKQCPAGHQVDMGFYSGSRVFEVGLSTKSIMDRDRASLAVQCPRCRGTAGIVPKPAST